MGFACSHQSKGLESKVTGKKKRRKKRKKKERPKALQALEEKAQADSALLAAVRQVCFGLHAQESFKNFTPCRSVPKYLFLYRFECKMQGMKTQCGGLFLTRRFLLSKHRLKPNNREGYVRNRGFAQS